MAEWRDGGMAGWPSDNGMAEWRNDGLAEWRNGYIPNLPLAAVDDDNTNTNTF
jgi:hypothetical protein